MSNLTDRQKRAVYRATYRGTKEMDWLLGKFVEQTIATMNESELETLEALLLLPDPQLENWFVGKDTAITQKFVDLIGAIRSFHKL